LKIEDKMVDNKAVKVLPKVWVQFNGLTKELCDFLIIWAVGSIIGITKDVDMVFTRKYDICRMQVLVLDPNLIPQFVDVVIGDSLYTLQFRVEENLNDNEPTPMDMDDFHDEDFQQEEDIEEGQENDGRKQQFQGNGSNKGEVFSGSKSAAPGNSGVKRQLFHIDTTMMDLAPPQETAPVYVITPEQENVKGVEVQDGGTVNIFDMPTPNSVNTSDMENYEIQDEEESSGENRLVGEVNNRVGEAELAAIPEATPGNSAKRWSKRRAGDTEEDSLTRATKLKAQRNEGDKDTDPLNFNLSDLCIESNLCSVGISLGHGKCSINESISKLREAAAPSVEGSDYDKKTVSMDKELIDLEDDEELDKLLLNQLCCEIMEEVMDLGDCKDDLLITPGSKTRKKKYKHKKKTKSNSR
jgi:hypothetical protein